MYLGKQKCMHKLFLWDVTSTLNGIQTIEGCQGCYYFLTTSPVCLQLPMGTECLEY